MYYYAFLSRENVVENLLTSETQLTDSNYVEITEAQYNSRELIGLQYDESTQTYATVPYWTCSTGDIQYRATDKGLVKALDEIEIAVANAASGAMTDAERTKLSGIAENANNYVHPDTHPASMITGLPTSLPANGGNADTVDNMHASDFAVASHTHSEYATVTALETLETTVSGKANTSHSHSQYATTGHNHDSDYAATSHTHAQTEITGLSTALSAKVDKVSGKVLSTNDYTTAEKNKLAGIATGANAYTHPSYTAKSSGLYKVTVDATGHVSATTAVTKADITALGIPAQDTNTTYNNATTSAAGLMSASDKSKLDGIASGANKTTVDSALSSTSTNPVQNKVINSALAGKSDTSHNHDTAYIAKALQITADDGNILHDYVATDDVLAKMAALACGMHTCYCPVNTVNSPKQTEAWRFLVHKTGASKNYGWCIALGSRGSVYSNYIDAGAWRGWKTIHDIEPVALWTGEYYMIASQTVTPSKTLSECRNGWVLVWSDYNAGEGSTNADINTTVVPKRNVTGAKWSGQSMIVPVATGLSSTAEITFAGKRIYVYDDKLIGHAVNNIAPSNDAVLRAVYEF